MNKYWISWIHEETYGSFELYLPWWCTGYDSEDNSLICAAILAYNEEEAVNKIESSYDAKPQHIIFRFIDEKEKEWSPFNDRFPKADWMKWNYEDLIK